MLLAGAVLGPYRAAKQSRIDHRLIQAIKAGRYDEAIQILANGASGDAHDVGDPLTVRRMISVMLRRPQNPAGDAAKERPSALMLLSRRFRCCEDGGQVQCPDPQAMLVRALLVHGARVNECNADWESPPLCEAVLRGAGNNVLEILLEGGADANLRDPLGATLLMYANSGSLSTLLKYGADIDATAHDGRNALMTAASGYEPDKVRILLQHHPNVNARDNLGRTALDYALENTDKARTQIQAMLRGHFSK